MGKDKVATVENFEFYSALSAEHNGASSIPLNRSGEPMVDRLSYLIMEKPNYKNDHVSITLAALGSYGILSRDVTYMYRWYGNALPLSPLWVGDLEFREELSALRAKEPTEKPNALEVASSLLSFVEEIPDQPLNSPYLDKDLNHIPVTADIRRTQINLREDIEAYKIGGLSLNLRIYDRPKDGVILNTTTQLQKLPNSVPFTTDKNDFDSGNTNMGLASSATHGERVTILADYQDYRLVHSKDYQGWAHKRDLAKMPEGFDESELRPVFYTAFFPSNFIDDRGNGHLFLPGDMAYEHRGGICVFRQGKNEMAELINLNGTTNFNIRGGELSPYGLLIAFTNIKTPYVWAHNDCASWMRKALRTAGYNIPKHSAGINKELGDTLGVEDKPLEDLTHGLYVISKPGHVWLAAVNQEGGFGAYSMAFQIKDSEGKIQSPVGMCESTREAVEQYQSLQIFRLTK